MDCPASLYKEKTDYLHPKATQMIEAFDKANQLLNDEVLALPDACDTAIQQINDRLYAADFRDDYDDILCYGIAFFKKRCMVRKK